MNYLYLSTMFIIVFLMSSCEIQKEYIINLKHEYDIEIHLANDLQSAGLLKPKIFATAVDTIITFIDVNNKMIRSWSLTKYNGPLF